MLVAGITTSYRPVESHLDSKRFKRVIESVNKDSNINKRITEGLELFVIKKEGSVEEKLKAMDIGYHELIEYLGHINISANSNIVEEPMQDEIIEVVENSNHIIEIEDEEVSFKNQETETSDALASGIEMISTMFREG